jgi:hypothetical protein
MRFNEITESSPEDRFKKYIRPVVKTTPKIEKDNNPSGRTTDHVEWKVTSPTGEIHRYNSKKQAQAHFDSFGQQGVAEGLSEMDNRTSSGDRREKRNNSPEEKARQDKEQQKRLTATSPEMRKKLRLPEPKQGVAEGETWSKHNNKRAGGMSKKSVASYRRSHPGSKIQTAVTTKPSKLKKGSKAAKRRASFCARMRGMKKHRTGAKTANDPNSNINKSLRRWHCESIEELHELVMLAEQFIRNKKNEL